MCWSGREERRDCSRECMTGWEHGRREFIMTAKLLLYAALQIDVFLINAYIYKIDIVSLTI